MHLGLVLGCSSTRDWFLPKVPQHLQIPCVFVSFGLPHQSAPKSRSSFCRVTFEEQQQQDRSVIACSSAPGLTSTKSVCARLFLSLRETWQRGDMTRISSLCLTLERKTAACVGGKRFSCWINKVQDNFIH